MGKPGERYGFHSRPNRSGYEINHSTGTYGGNKKIYAFDATCSCCSGGGGIADGQFCKGCIANKKYDWELKEKNNSMWDKNNCRDRYKYDYELKSGKWERIVWKSDGKAYVLKKPHGEVIPNYGQLKQEENGRLEGERQEAQRKRIADFRTKSQWIKAGANADYKYLGTCYTVDIISVPTLGDVKEGGDAGKIKIRFKNQDHTVTSMELEKPGYYAHEDVERAKAIDAVNFNQVAIMNIHQTKLAEEARAQTN